VNFQPSGPVLGPSNGPPAGPLIQKQITVIQVPSLDRNKDKNNKTGGEANRDQLRLSLVSHGFLCIFLNRNWKCSDFMC
jgi:hypothetical protein